MPPFKLKPYIEFYEWCKSEPSGEQQYESFNLSQELNQDPATQDRFNSLIETLNGKLGGGKYINLLFNAQIQPSEELNTDCKYLISGNDAEKSDLINTLNVQDSPNQKCPLAFKNLKIRISNISGNNASIQRCRF